MPRLILLLIVVAAVLYFGYRYRGLNAAAKKSLQRFCVWVLVAGIFGVLLITGKLGWLLAAIGALLPLVPRVIRFFMAAGPTLMPYFQRFQQNRQSNMSGRFVSLQIDMLTGSLQGEILEGDFAGQKLQGMALQDILKLLEQCKAQDSKSAALLEAYLDRQHAGWAGGNAKSEETFSDAGMSQQQALDVLGLKEGAGKKEIIKAHKRLMQSLHPDRGGSDYLAQQINRARDVLLKGF